MHHSVVDFIEKKNKIESEISRKSFQHSKGKLTARERILFLLDEDSFEEYGLFINHRSNSFGVDKKEIPYDGVITGYGTIFGRPVFIFSQDFSISGGSVGEMHAKKINHLQDLALKSKIPIISIQDSGGARIQEGIDALVGYGDIFQKNIESSGVIPQISLIMGPCAGGAVYAPALTDFIFMTEGTSFMYITGPDVVKKVTLEDTTHETLGGSLVHEKKSGAIDGVFKNDIELLTQVKRLFTFLPQSCFENPPIYNNLRNFDKTFDDNEILDNIIPENSNIPYDMKNIISEIVDNGDYFEIQPEFAKNIITCLARIGNATVGIVANQPMELSGCIDINASRKAARFIRFCDCFNIPIVSLVDTPGFLPGTAQEYNNIIRHGAKLLYAYGEATCPKITLILRKAYGGAYISMGSKPLKSDFNYSWPMAEIAVLGADSAVEILFKKVDPEEKAKKIQEYKEKYINPYFSASRGYVDQIIKPRTTRKIIYKSLVLLKDKIKIKERKHDNLPL